MDWYKREIVIWKFYKQWNREKEVLNHVCKLLNGQVSPYNTRTTISEFTNDIYIYNDS